MNPGLLSFHVGYDCYVKVHCIFCFLATKKKSKISVLMLIGEELMIGRLPIGRVVAP